MITERDWVPVPLNPNEDEVAKLIARIRRTQNNGRSNLAGGERLTAAELMANDITGARAEQTNARYLNLYWTGIYRGDKKKTTRDVGDLLQVRAVDDPRLGLLVRPTDDDNDPFVGVYVEERAGKIICWQRGWEYAAIAKRLGTLRDKYTDKPYWTMPWEYLRPMPKIFSLIAIPLLSSRIDLTYYPHLMEQEEFSAILPHDAHALPLIVAAPRRLLR